MANVQVGGLHLLIDAEASTSIQVGGLHLLIDAEASTSIQVGGLMLLVDAEPESPTFNPSWARRINNLIVGGVYRV